MEQFMKLAMVALVTAVATTGFVVATGVATSSDAGSNEAALKRDEDELDAMLASTDDDDDDKTMDPKGSAPTRAGGDRSASNDRSRDVTSKDRSRSLDRSWDATGDKVGGLDRSNSLDWSRDRTGDHDSRDVSRSRDRSGDQTNRASVSRSPVKAQAPASGGNSVSNGGGGGNSVSAGSASGGGST